VIPNTTNLVAVFQREGHGEYQRAIIAWDGDGEALVAPKEGTRGRLRLARQDPDFAYVMEAESGALNGYIGVLPGGGWMTHWVDMETHEIVEEPVVGWAVTHNGDAYPIVSDGEGGASTGTDAESGERIFHPSKTVKEGK
jgi:hypothetical protein